MNKIEFTFFTYHQPDAGIVYSKNIGRKVVWLVTKEMNFCAVWRGFTKDEQPWDDSDWTWEMKGIFSGRNEAIEKCVVCALEEKQ